MPFCKNHHTVAFFFMVGIHRVHISIIILFRKLLLGFCLFGSGTDPITVVLSYMTDSYMITPFLLISTHFLEFTHYYIEIKNCHGLSIHSRELLCLTMDKLIFIYS